MNATPLTNGIEQVPPSLTAVLIIAVTALAATIVFLFRYYSGRQATVEGETRKLITDHAKEREEWAAEREKLEGFRDQLRAEYATRQADDLRKLYEAAREHDNAVRREYIANMECVATKAAEAHEKISTVMNKMSDRLLGRRGSPY